MFKVSEYNKMKNFSIFPLLITSDTTFNTLFKNKK